MLDQLLKIRDIRSLDRAVVLAEELNYLRAANRLCITQSALSRSISNLEESLDICLFDRDQTGVRITPVGLDFLSSAKRILEQLTTFFNEIDGFRKGIDGRAAFGITPALAQLDIMKEALATLLANNSNFNVEMEVKGSARLLTSLLSEQIEFYLTLEGAVDKSVNRLVLEPLCRTELAVAVRNGHPLLGKESVTSSDITNFPMFSYRLPRRWTEYNGEAVLGLNHESHFRTIVYCDDVSFLMKLAAKTDALILVMKEAMMAQASYGLVELPVDILTSQWSDLKVVIVTLANKSLSPLATLLIEILRSRVVKL